ncbi:interferon-induced protein with tetratricopeptide repeats 5-like [Engraulis encrasicolus]|uniref:interferon-induced protein with tetratricopeptide repeats 5-like n=1 Tax=Engraulis encrasicolus TaxID=184585 RepID=UPI002FD17950
MLEHCPSHDRALKTNLLKLQCHFTWALSKENADLSDLQTRLEDQIELDLGKKEGAARSHCFLAFVRYLQGSSDDAIANLVQSEELVREHHGEDYEQFLIVTYGNYAWLHYHRGEYPQCESYLEKLADIMQKFPTGSPTVLHPQVYGEKGWTFLKFSHKYYDRAKEYFKRALELEPDSSEWNAGYAFALYRTEFEMPGVKDSETVKQLRRAIEINPQDAVLRVLLGLRLNILKQYEESEELVADALEMDPSNPHVIRYVGKYFRHNGSVDRSIVLLKRAMERTQNSAFLHHQLALCYKRKKLALFRTAGGKGKGREISQLICQVIYHLEQATTLKANFILAMADLALHYGESKAMARAEEMFKSTFDAAREKREALQVVHLYYAQYQQHCKKRETLAIKHYRDCLTLEPTTYEGKQSASSLKEIAEKRLARDRHDAEAFGILGFVHKAKGERRRALECFEKAMEIDCSNDEYLSAHCELSLSLQ